MTMNDIRNLRSTFSCEIRNFDNDKLVWNGADYLCRNIAHIPMVQALLMKYGNNQPFYAEQAGLSGAQVSALRKAGFIKWTGKTVPAFVEVGDDLYKKVSAKEWQVAVTKEQLAVLIQWCELGTALIVQHIVEGKEED